MNIVITGGAGFLGHRLARALLDRGLPGVEITRLVLADRLAPAELRDHRAHTAVGDIADPAFVTSVITEDVDLIFHLAAVVSSQAEADFDLGLKINVDASRLILDRCRGFRRPPRVIFTSSVAVFGPSEGAEIGDHTAVDPRSSYGMEKAVAELLLKDYSRRGFLDGLVLRLPTIAVRPGQPNRAASSFASGIIREPLGGQRAQCPVPADTALWLLSPRRATESLMRAATLETSRFSANRVINLPGISVTVDEMLRGLQEAGGREARNLVYEAPDPAIERIVRSWPRAWDDSRALALGFRKDADFSAIIAAFIADDLQATQRD